MKLLFKQRLLSWLDSSDIYNEAGDVVFRVEGQLAWGHRFHIYDAYNCHVATLRQKMLTFLPRYEIIIGGKSFGDVRKELTLLRPRFVLDHIGWVVEGNLTQWEYDIKTITGQPIAHASKELLQWTDTYSLDVFRAGDALTALLVVLAIDAEKDR